MKKTLLFLIIGLFLSTFATAQLVNETFETQPTVASGTHPSVSISGWLNHATAGTRTWLARQFGDPVNRYAQATAFNATADASNVMWLIAPGVNMDLSTGESLSFQYNSGYDNGFALAVLYSNNFDGTTGGIATATWTDITSNFTIPAGSSSAYGTLATAGSMNVSALTGTVYFAFRYTGAATGTTTTVQIDNILLSGTVGINEVNLFETAVYPNPVSDILTISEASNITVTSVTGQIVLKASNSTSVDMSNLTKGMYIVTIENREGIRSEKIFKN
jgi:hypothetical protein